MPLPDAPARSLMPPLLELPAWQPGWWRERSAGKGARLAVHRVSLSTFLHSSTVGRSGREGGEGG